MASYPEPQKFAPVCDAASCTRNATAVAMIPTEHEPLAEERVESLAAWIEESLDRLEHEHRRFMTPQGFLGSVRGK